MIGVNAGFQYFHFPALHIDAVAKQFSKYHSQSILARSFVYWLDSFAHRASLFYQVQRTNHGERVWSQFCRAYGIHPDRSVGEYGLEYEWEQYRHASGLAKHEGAEERACTELAGLQDAYRKAGKDFLGDLEKRDTYDLILRTLEGELTELVFEPAFDALWFDTVVANHDAMLAVELNRMPYKDFLKSDYWRQVRAAMLLLCGAKCQNAYCIANTEGAWLGDEYRVHVHHLDYVHRGAERYVELTLLCDTCHSRIHAGDPKVRAGIARPELRV